MASNKAACVLGGVLLISSARMIFEKMGPFMNLNCLFSSKISLPKISEGIKSGVNCILLKHNPSASETVFTSNVFAKPGTPINKE